MHSHNQYIDNSPMRSDNNGGDSKVNDYQINDGVINIDKSGCYFIRSNQKGGPVTPQEPQHVRKSTLDTYRKNIPSGFKKARTGENASTTAVNFFKEDITEQPEDLSIYSDVSELGEKKTIDQIVTISNGLKHQDSKVQMTN